MLRLFARVFLEDFGEGDFKIDGVFLESFGGEVNHKYGDESDFGNTDDELWRAESAKSVSKHQAGGGGKWEESDKFY